MKLKKTLFTLIFIFFSVSSFAQYEIIIEASVIDKNTNQPIAYVNVEFLRSDIKTISNKNGQFKLIFDKNNIENKSLFCISALGYKTIKVESSQLFKLLKNTNKIYLAPESNIISKIVIKKQRQEENRVIVKGNIYGTVTSGSQPVQGATIIVKNSFNETQTDVNGNYSLNAQKDDVLEINYLGMLTKGVLISNKSNINIDLEPYGEVLDEVFLEGMSKKEELEELIDLGLSGKKSFDAIGTSVNIISAKDIKPYMIDMGDLLRGKFAGVNNVGEGKFTLRGGGSITNSALAAYDVDGALYAFNGVPPPYVDPQNVESIVILKSLAATNKYGTLGRGGVIVIRTKTNGYNKAKKEIPSLLATENDYKNTSILPKFTTKKAAYIQQLEEANSYHEAITIYKRQKKQSSQLSIPYFVEVSHYFKRWDKAYEHTILMSIANLAYNNAKALKTLAYTLESQGKLEDAKQVYQRIAVLQPNAAQSFRNLALIYQQTGYCKEAINLYGQMLNNQIENVDFSGLQQPITSELQYLLAKHRSKVDYSNIHADYLRVDFKYDLRIVFDWNDPNAEFEIQFVNPKNKFFKWSQTIFDNKERMIDGITKGYHTEEFIIDEDEAGEWIINIESLNEEPQLNPTYLKYTVFRNYGLANETKKVKVINLNDCNPKITLDKLINR